MSAGYGKLSLDLYVEFDIMVSGNFIPCRQTLKGCLTHPRHDGYSITRSTLVTVKSYYRFTPPSLSNRNIVNSLAVQP